MSGAKSSRARESDKGEQDIFYSSDSELGTGAIKVGGLTLVIRAVLVILPMRLDSMRTFILDTMGRLGWVHYTPQHYTPTSFVDMIKLMHHGQMLRI